MDRIHRSVNALSLGERGGVRELFEYNFSGRNRPRAKESAARLPSFDLFV